MKRYSLITEKNPREIVLLRGSGCRWRRCRFCDYHLDFSKDEAANFQLNMRELHNVTGRFGVLEVINSGSFSDLDERTVAEIIHVCRQKKIRQLHIECHWKDRDTLAEIRKRLEKSGIYCVVKMGVETFDTWFREEVLCKGMDYTTPQQIAEYADEICLLFGLTGQSEASMKRDINTGLQYFKRVCINLMEKNTSLMKPDPEVIRLFLKELYGKYRDNDRIDILLQNTDFGVGGIKDE